MSTNFCVYKCFNNVSKIGSKSDLFVDDLTEYIQQKKE